MTYHMVIEGTLALTGQYFQTDWMERRGILPGHLEGFRKISQDEHRHVAYGTWYLKQVAGDPAHAARIQDRLMALLPAAAGVLVPPGYEPRRRVRVHGLHQPGDERVRVHRAHAAAEGHRRLAGRRARLRPHLITVISGWVASSVWVKT